MSYLNSKVAVRDSFDDEDASDDVEDEVFIRDGRNGCKNDEERGVKRPLMAPRRKAKSNQMHNEVLKRSLCKVFCAPCCYGILALSTLLGLITLVVLFILWFPFSFNRIIVWKIGEETNHKTSLEPCTQLSVTDVWTRSLPKLTIESSIHVSDLNKDKVQDVIIGYGTGADEVDASPIVCTVYFGGATPCLGGVLALDGKTGRTLWQHWTPHTVYSVDCGADVTGDGSNDCLASGKGGVLHAINGHDGSLLWSFVSGNEFEKLFSVYSGQFVSDVDGDGVLDILATQTEDEGPSLVGHLLLISGINGKPIQVIDTPDNEESYYAPQILVREEGINIVLFGTGGQSSAGGLYALPLQKLVLGDTSRLEIVYHDNLKGVMSPPVLADINADNCEDIIVATFNSAVLAFDGLTFALIWNYTFPDSETLSPPTPVYFNDDDVPDFLVKYQTGPGFPIYFYSQTMVLNGITGKKLLEKPMIDSVSAPAAAITVSVEGFGNDFVLFWSAQCVGHEGATDSYSFLPGLSIQAQSRADTCKMRFNSTQEWKFWAFNQHLPPPGIAIYSSSDRQMLEYNNSISSKLEAQRYMSAHPDFRDMFVKGQTYQAVEKKVPVDSPGQSSFRHKTGPYRLPNHKNFYRTDQPESQRELLRGEEEQPEAGYLPDKYPNVRKHGDKPTKHPHQHWYQPQSRWQQNTEPEKLYENMALNHETDYESLYDRVNNAPQRDERNKREVKQARPEGVHRLSSTGTLVSPLVTRDDTFEVIFTTYWLPPAADDHLVFDNYQDCIQKTMEQAEGNVKYYGMGQTALEAAVAADCDNNKRDVFDVPLGQMTVYRVRVSCRCPGVADTESCSTVLPLNKQSWPSFMGADGNGYFKARHKGVRPT